MCPDPAYIQSLQATRNATIWLTPTTAPRKANHASHDKVPNDGLVQRDANATATTCNSSLPSHNWAADISHTEDIIMSPAQQGCQVDLQVALDKHRDDILCLLRTQWMLTKICAVNMGTMVKINDSFAQAGGKALTVMKLKELGSKAEHKAWSLYNTWEDGHIPFNRTDTKIPDGQPPVKGSPGIEEFWRSYLPDGFHINSMNPDGNCLFRSLSDQLNHDNGEAHDFIRHQIINHIRRHSDEFKDFLLLQDNHEDISDPDSYIQKMVQNGEWGGNPEVYVAAWLYGVNINIYSQEYTNTNGMLVINTDGHQGAIDMVHAMWTISYHENNHYNSIRLPGNPPIPMRHIMSSDSSLTYNRLWMNIKMC